MTASVELFFVCWMLESRGYGFLGEASLLNYVLKMFSFMCVSVRTRISCCSKPNNSEEECTRSESPSDAKVGRVLLLFFELSLFQPYNPSSIRWIRQILETLSYILGMVVDCQNLTVLQNLQNQYSAPVRFYVYPLFFMGYVYPISHGLSQKRGFQIRKFFKLYK